MKKLITLAAAPVLAISLAISPAIASEQEHFREAVEQAIGPIVREEIPTAIKETEHLVEQAVEIVSEASHKFHDKEKLLLETLVANAKGMLSQDPETLEENWHHGEALEDKGIELDEFDHFSPVMAYYDMIIHPATAHSLLKAYQQDPEHHLLEQAREELSELLEHDEEESEESGGHGGSDH